MRKYFEDGGTWRRIAEEGRLMVFERIGEPEDEREIRMCGVFDDSGQLALILNTIQMAKLDGALHVSSGDRRSVLYFRKGVLLSARSNSPQDMLGQVLLRTGRVEAEVVEAALAEADDQLSLGKVLVRRGILSTQQVYVALREQTEQIVVSSLRFARGTYCLIAPLDMTVIPAMLHLDTQSVLLNALTKIDEERAQAMRYNKPEADDLRRMPPMPMERMAEGGVESILDTYNEALRRMFSAVSSEIARRIQTDVAAFVRRGEVSYRDVFEAVEIAENGTLDRARILANVERLGTSGMHHLQVGLSELLFFVLFAAGDAVENRAKSGLHRGVAEAMKGLIGNELP